MPLLEAGLGVNSEAAKALSLLGITSGEALAEPLDTALGDVGWAFELFSAEMAFRCLIASAKALSAAG